MVATKQAVDEDGWLNSGDIGWIVPTHSVGRSRHCGGVIVLEGRAKDTIVLSTGNCDFLLYTCHNNVKHDLGFIHFFTSWSIILRNMKYNKQ